MLSPNDSLLDCLLWFSQREHQTLSRVALISGLPLVNGQLTLPLFSRAAERAGFLSRMGKRNLRDISPLLTPLILILQDNQACVLEKIDHEKMTVIFSGKPPEVITIDALEKKYTGISILMKPVEKTFYQEASEKHPWLSDVIDKYKPAMKQVILASVLLNILSLAVPLFVRNVYDRVIPNFTMETLWVLAIGALIALSFDFALRLVRSYSMDFTAKSADISLANYLFTRILNMRVSHKPPAVDIFVSKLTAYEFVREFLTSATLTTLIDFPFVLLFLGVIGMIGGKIVLVPIIIMLGFGFLAVFVEKRLRPITERAHHANIQKQAILAEGVHALETFKLFRAEGFALSRFDNNLLFSEDAAFASRRYYSLLMYSTYFFSQLVTIFTIIVGVYLVADNQLSTGGLFAITILTGKTLGPVVQMAGLLTRYQHYRQGLRLIDSMVSIPSEITTKPHRPFPSAQPNIRFEQVSFRYPGQKRNALENINLTIAPKEHVAIIGKIGAGKSTLLKMLAGFYVPSAGKIQLDNVDFNDVDLSDLRSHLSYAGPDTPLISGTLRENIALGHFNVSDADIMQAAAKAGIAEWIDSFSSGLDTMVIENGKHFSQGQRQALILARAILNNGSIMLFDDPTDNMDYYTERLFIKQAPELLKEKTLILITHRNSMLSLVDRLIIMDNGRIVADGPKQSVLESSLFKRE